MAKAKRKSGRQSARQSRSKSKSRAKSRAKPGANSRAQSGAKSAAKSAAKSNLVTVAALKRAASPAEPEPEPPPIEATLSRIDYNLKIDGDLATGEARLTVDVIKNGWVRVPLPDGLMVRDAQLDGHPVNLATQSGESGRLDLLLSKTGRSVLTLKIVAPVKTVAGTDVLQLPVSNSAVSHAAIESRNCLISAEAGVVERTTTISPASHEMLGEPRGRRLAARAPAGS